MTLGGQNHLTFRHRHPDQYVIICQKNIPAQILERSKILALVQKISCHILQFAANPMQDWRRIIVVTRRSIQMLGATQLTTIKDGKTVLYVKVNMVCIYMTNATLDLFGYFGEVVF